MVLSASHERAAKREIPMIRYEWVIETIEDDEIADVDHVDGYPGPQEGCHVGLVRDRLTAEDDDVEDRQWAYVVNGVLPDTFDGGAKVPSKYKSEVLNWHKATA